MQTRNLLVFTTSVHMQYIFFPLVFGIKFWNLIIFINWYTIYGGIALGYGLHERGFESRQGLRIFLFATVSRPALGFTQPLTQCVPGALSLGVKWPGREADHSPPSSAEVKNEWSYTSTPQYAFVAWCSVKAQGQLYLYPIPHGGLINVGFSKDLVSSR
jgi:hypothetical protein